MCKGSRFTKTLNFQYCRFVAEPPIHIQILQLSTFLLRNNASEPIPPAVKDLYTNLWRLRHKNAFPYPVDCVGSPSKVSISALPQTLQKTA